MTCDQRDKCLLYLWDEMDTEQLKAFTAHLSQCPACRQETEQLKSLVGTLREIGLPSIPQSIIERIRQRLTPPAETPARRLWLGPRGMLAVAASVLLVAGIALLWINFLPSSNAPDQPKQVANNTVADETAGTMAILSILDDELTAEIGQLAGEVESFLEETSYGIEDYELQDPQSLRKVWELPTIIT